MLKLKLSPFETNNERLGYILSYIKYLKWKYKIQKWVKKDEKRRIEISPRNIYLSIQYIRI